MKNLIVLLVLSFFLVCCNNKPESETKEQTAPTKEVSENIDPPKQTETQNISSSDCILNIAKLDSTIWTEKEYSINYIMDSQLPKIDSLSAQRLLNCGVLDESRRTAEIEGEPYEYSVNYYYYNAYELEHYLLLTFLEEIVDGPEYSFIAISIDPKTNEIIDSKYMLSIWLDQYEANFTIEFQLPHTLAVFKNTKNLYSSDIMDSIEVSNMYYYYEIDDEGKLVETMVEDQYYKCGLLDYENGLVNEEGKRDNVLFAILPDFNLKMNDFYYGEELPYGDYELFTADASDRVGDIILNYSTGGIYGPSGSPFRNELIIIPRDTDFKIVKVEQQYSTTLLFSEDGMGGIWHIPEVETSTSQWAQLENIDEFTYGTLSKNEMEQYKAPISSSSFAAALNYKNENEGEMEIDYYEDVVNAKLRITYLASSGEEKGITLNFDFEYGD